MATAMITLVGCGPGGAAYLTDAAKEAVEAADVIAGAERLLALFPDAPGERLPIGADIEAGLDAVAASLEKGSGVAVLATGDPGLYSLARRLRERFGADECRTVAGVSSIQVACARVGVSWEAARIISAHGRSPEIPPADLVREDIVLILGGGEPADGWLRACVDALTATHEAWICRDLTLPGELVVRAEGTNLEHLSGSRVVLVFQRRSSE
jgi:cobalt-precorrin-7 (C5)-methyltransferase